MSVDLAAANESRPAIWFEWLLGSVACAVLFGPLVAAHFYYSGAERLDVRAAAETIGIAVIVRAMLRRIFRAGARSVMQTTVGTVTRASSRTMTRRVVRVGVKSLTMWFARSSSLSIYDESEGTDESPPGYQPMLLALALGIIAISLSLAGVFLLLDIEPDPTSVGTTQLSAVLGGMSLPAAVVLGVLPLLVYVTMLRAAAPHCGVEVGFRTGWEALLLQAYFTGSGSFLPLSTDSEMKGPSAACARLAIISLGGLLTVHWVLAGVATYVDSYLIQYIDGMFLLYCFVFSFPIAPLDGYYLWAHSRWLWLAMWLPVLASFIWLLPESLNVIL